MNIKYLPIYTITAVTVIILLLVITYLFYNLYRYKLQAITAGLEDDALIKEYGNKNIKSVTVTNILSIAVSLILFVIFVVSIYAKISGNYFPIKGIGNIQVVASGSMSYKNQANVYLDENNLDNQFNTYDLIIVEEKPLQDEIGLYDVVVYKSGDRQVVHRIIEFVETTEGTKYVLRGDANAYSDTGLVGYEQIIGVYNGIKIPAVGIFVLFLQSPLGYITIGLVMLMEFVAPVFEKKLYNAAQERIAKIYQ